MDFAKLFNGAMAEAAEKLSEAIEAELSTLEGKTEAELLALLNSRTHLRQRYILIRFSRLPEGASTHADMMVGRWLCHAGLCTLVDYGREKDSRGNHTHAIVRISALGKKLLPSLELNYPPKSGGLGMPKTVGAIKTSGGSLG